MDRLYKDRRVVHRVTTSGTTNDNDWQWEVEGITTSGTKSDSESQQVTMNDNGWQQ